MSDDYYTRRDFDFLQSKQADDAYWDERMRLENERRTQDRLAVMTPQQRANNPAAQAAGHFTGRCSQCHSTNLWDDNLHYGCRDCGAILG